MKFARIKQALIWADTCKFFTSKFFAAVTTILIFCAALYLIEKTIVKSQTLNLSGAWETGLFGVPNTYWLGIFSTAMILPVLFSLTKKCKFDEFIGSLSYPLYLCHYFVLGIVGKFEVEQNKISMYVLLFSIIVSMALVFFVEKPITKLRHRKFYGKKGLDYNAMDDLGAKVPPKTHVAA